MNEIVKSWLEGLITKEIGDVLDDIQNKKIWLFGSSDKEAIQTQLDNLCLDNEYLTALKTLKNRIEKEDI
jgi:hypothetical protein